MLTWYLERGGRSLLSFGAEQETQRAAAGAIADLIGNRRLEGILVEKIDGIPVLEFAGAAADALIDAGFTRTPRGLRLRR